MDFRKLARILRALAAGDVNFDALAHRRFSGLPMFVAGLGAGLLLGLLVAPSSGEELRSDLGRRARDVMGKTTGETSGAPAPDVASRAGFSTVEERKTAS